MEPRSSKWQVNALTTRLPTKLLSDYFDMLYYRGWHGPQPYLLSRGWLWNSLPCLLKSHTSTGGERPSFACPVSNSTFITFTTFGPWQDFEMFLTFTTCCLCSGWSKYCSFHIRYFMELSFLASVAIVTCWVWSSFLLSVKRMGLDILKIDYWWDKLFSWPHYIWIG